jgi:hypothetical protein
MSIPSGESIDYLRNGIRGFDEISYEMEKIEILTPEYKPLRGLFNTFGNM